MPSDPWSKWTMSGISLGLCNELQQRNLLYGAIHPGALSTRHLRRPAIFYSQERLLQKLLSRYFPRQNDFEDEKKGIVGRVLKNCPDQTPVIYSFLTPEYDHSLPIKRYRFMDLSLLDAVKYDAYGHGGFSDEMLATAYEQQKRTMEEADGVITLSSYAADSLTRDFDYPREKITAIGAGPSVETTPNRVNDLDRYTDCRILFVGRDWERKNGKLLVEAFKIVKQVLSHAKLVIIGPDELPAECNGVAGIEWLGLLSKDKPEEKRQLQNQFANCSAFCMPSIAETWGLVYVEAAQAGLPIAGFQEWALPDIVANNKTGVLVQEKTSAALAEALLTILRNPEVALKMGNAAQQHIDNTLSWKHVADRLLFAVAPDLLSEPPVFLQTSD